jgi:hypothetical protein
LDDARLENYYRKYSFIKEFLVLFIGIWVIMTLLPTLYLNTKQVDKKLTKTDFIGWGIWLFGFIFEVIADKQKMAFKNDSNNQVYLIIFILKEKFLCIHLRENLSTVVFGNILDIQIILVKCVHGLVFIYLHHICLLDMNDLLACFHLYL